MLPRRTGELPVMVIPPEPVRVPPMSIAPEIVKRAFAVRVAPLSMVRSPIVVEVLRSPLGAEAGMKMLSVMLGAPAGLQLAPSFQLLVEAPVQTFEVPAGI